MSELLADSLAHATLTGTWMDRPAGATFAALQQQLDQHGYAFACAVGMWGMDGFEAEAYATACRGFPRLVPVAGFRPESHDSLRADLARLRDLGYRGIKLHPRFSRLDVADPLIGQTMEFAGQLDLVVFWCTYLHTSIEAWQTVDPLLALVDQLRAAPSARVVLLHGGDVDLLRYMQLVRFNDRLLLDLSHTIAKYPGSSVEKDVEFLFRHFDRRICLGTDWPQFSHAQLRVLYERFATGLPPEKRVNIAHGNLARFLKVNVD
jgi:predicted TIM-barrel fold metal-dependent hydrolase